MNGISSTSTSRHTIPTIGASATSSGVFIKPNMADVNANDHQHHRLSFLNSRTGEAIRTCYRSNGKSIHGTIKRKDHNMHDYCTGEINPIAPKLSESPLHAPISIISGHRSPRIYAVLREITKDVAQTSLQMEGCDIDIRMIRHLTVQLKSDSTSYYPKSDFFHLDTGQ
jgi:uncharacterized protein YcbK (DUF882 family)